MDGARLLVDRLVHPHTVEQRVGVDVDCESVASAGSRTFSMSAIRSPKTVPCPQPLVVVRFRVFVEILEPVPRLDDHRADVPVDLDSDDILDALKQPLVAQIADRERFGRRAERHQRDELVLVDIEGQRMLTPAIGVSRTAPVSSMACTPNVDGRAAFVSTGR